MATLVPEDPDLVLRLSPIEKLGGLHGDVRVPLAAVQYVDVCRDPFGALRGIRAPGTGFPRLIALGTWRYRGGRDFATLYRGKPAVIVQLREAAYKRLLVSVDDAAAVAAQIRAAA